MKKKLKWFSALVIGLIAFSNFWIISFTHQDIVNDSRELLGAEIGLVLGTSKKLVGGESNPFFQNRMEAAAQLIKSGKVEKLILSGSSDEQYYDEPSDMQNALVDLGVSPNQLILDNKGDRTLTSLARLRDIHGFNRCVIVTQKYHSYRALFIAKHLGIDAKCFTARSPNFKDHFKAILREVLARTKAILDLYILGN
ncbi:MAG: YdcF family protein [Reichenbachiella sp.]